MIDLYYPLRSLKEGHWFKLICGASFQDLPAIRNLSLAYALAGADCIDLAADPAIVIAVREAFAQVQRLMPHAWVRGYPVRSLPWLMVSLNAGEDPHFRKASFDPSACPSDCPRPCERGCPAQAIAFTAQHSGVIDRRCYGCGRCLPLCPLGHITTRACPASPAAIASVLSDIDALEIHTQVGHLSEFQALWQAIAPMVSSLKLIAISCPDGEGLIEYLWALYHHMHPLPCALLWQTDGRPMSGDIGDGTTHAAIQLGQKVLAAGLPGYVQLAGGTNRYTVPKLRSLGLLPTPSAAKTGQQSWETKDPWTHIAGVAYGSYARVLLAPVLDSWDEVFSLPLHRPVQSPWRTDRLSQGAIAPSPTAGSMTQRPKAAFRQSLEEVPELLWQAVDLAYQLVGQLKPPFVHGQ